MPVSVSSQQIVVESPEGESYLMAVRGEDSFLSVVNSIYECLKSSMLDHGMVSDYESLPNSCLQIEVQPFEGGILVKAAQSSQSKTRNYNTPVTAQEKKDISYVIKSLGFENQVKLMTMQSSLNQAGDRIDHIHPFQFLATIFTDEELKVAMRRMQGKAFVWSTFVDNLTKTANEENAKGNMMPFVQDFAKRVKLDQNLILPSIKSSNWEKFLDVLIANIPRQGQTDRYDM